MVPKDRASFDLHALSAPPAFVLSQDQTLQNWRVFHSTIQFSRCLAAGLRRTAFQKGPAVHWSDLQLYKAATRRVNEFSGCRAGRGRSLTAPESTRSIESARRALFMAESPQLFVFFLDVGASAHHAQRRAAQAPKNALHVMPAPDADRRAAKLFDRPGLAGCQASDQRAPGRRPGNLEYANIREVTIGQAS